MAELSIGFALLTRQREALTGASIMLVMPVAFLMNPTEFRSYRALMP